MQYSKIEEYYTILSKYTDKKLPIKLEMAISRNIYILKPIAEEVISKRLELLDKYASKKDDGSYDITTLQNGAVILNFKTPDEKVSFEKDMNEILEMTEDVELVCIDEEVLYQLDDTRYDDLTATDLMKLDFIIKH